jgi:glycosyltransferase involved in cell wall biosynthesis
MTAPRISLIVPAYNEAVLLPRLLDSVDAARAAYREGPNAVEVIVADNASTDTTAAIAHERGCRVVPVSRRCIAAARNGGAAIAQGETLCFVDADTRIHPQTFNAVERRLADPRAIAGACGVRLERWSLGLVLTWLTLVPIVVVLRLDTGVVFCRRADFLAIDGYDETRLIAEDVDFLWRLRRLGKTRGQRLTRASGAKGIASTRKFDQYGDWHYFTQMPVLAWKILRNPAARSEFVQRYWYDDRK